MINHKVQKLGVVLQNSSTGGWRYTCRLIESIRKFRPEIEVTAYLGRRMKTIGERESSARILSGFGAKVSWLPSLRPLDQRDWFRFGLSYFVRATRSASRRRWLKDLATQDVALFAWPFGIDCPETSCPLAFIPHDFNYTHFMGTFVESRKSANSLRLQHERWLKKASPIVSSNFIANELRRSFPQSSKSARVIPLSHLGSGQPVGEQESLKTMRSLGVKGDYILSLNNISAHKNLGQLLSGFYYAKQKAPNLKLIIVGFGTEGICGNANSPFYIDNVDRGGEVISLGLREDHEVTALIKHAKLVVNSSLYEAGNGSGLDAWTLGTPVAMSAIPPFLEQMQDLGVWAETFNPRCCYEIGDAISRVIKDPERARANAESSMHAMKKYTWIHVAEKYLNALDDIVMAAKVESGSVMVKAA